MKVFQIMVVLLAASSSVQAEEGSSYVGFYLSNSSADWDEAESFSGLDTDESLSGGFEAIWGTYLSDQLAFEISLKSIGSISLEGREGDQFELDGTAYVWTRDVFLDADISAWNSKLRYDFYAQDKITLFGKIGWVRGTYSYESDIESLNGEKDSFSASSFGFGIDYRLDDRTHLRAAYDVINNDDVFTGLHVGLIYNYN